MTQVTILSVCVSLCACVCVLSVWESVCVYVLLSLSVTYIAHITTDVLWDGTLIPVPYQSLPATTLP